MQPLLPVVAATALVLFVNSSLLAQQDLSDQLQFAVTFAGSQLSATATSGLSTTQYPLAAKPGKTWTLKNQSSWISGMFPGSLWAMHRLTGEAAYASYAQAWSAAIQPAKQNNHFKVFAAYKPWYEYNGDSASYQRLLDAAELEESTYIPLPDAGGHNVGVRGMFCDLAAWRPGSADYPSSLYVANPVDRLMDIPSLLWMARQTGDFQLRDKALTHARTGIQQCMRPDGGSHHWCYVHMTSGLSATRAYQNYADDTTWSRGQSWVIYATTGIAEDAHLRGDTAVMAEFLALAKAAADFWLNHPNLPADGVPLWDFDSPSRLPPEHCDRDSSAAAATCSALIDLSQLVSDPVDKSRYMAAAEQILGSLCTSKSQGGYLNLQSDGTAGSSGILAHGVYSHSYSFATGNSGVFSSGIIDDGAMIWGDYYFLEAIEKYRKLSGTPSNLVAKVIHGSRIDLTWADNAIGETAFQIERKVGTGAWAMLADDLPADTIAYNDTTCSQGITHTYRVRVIRSEGPHSSWSNEAEAVVHCPVIATDDMEGGVSGGTGWSNDWTLVSPAQFNTAHKHGGTYSLRVNDKVAMATRTVNMAGLRHARLTVWHRALGLDPGDQAVLEIYDGAWHIVGTITQADNSVWKQRDLDISGYQMISGFQIRFRPVTLAYGEFVYFDDITITASIPGDVSGDGLVNVGDLQLLVAAWNSSNASSHWNPAADNNADGYVNVGDLHVLVANWGR